MERSRVAAPSGRRTILLYTFGIVLPALVLLAQGLISIRREREAAHSLRRSNLILERQNLAAALESRAEELARSALEDPVL